MIRHPSRWTLRTKLVASIVTLFIIVTSLTGLATVLWMRNSLLGQLDTQLRSMTVALGAPRDRDHDIVPSTTNRGHHAPPGLGSGQLRVTVADGTTCAITENSVTTPEGSSKTLSLTTACSLTSHATSQPTTVDLGDELGHYRVAAFRQTDGDVSLIGLPLDPIDNSIAHLARNIAALGALGLMLMIGASTLLVRRNLRPLARVAATAERVSELPLSEGAARTAERVPARDTDAHTEVGTVGLALNNLLDHVDNALDARHRSEMQVRQFVADASHELRTPLASIRGYAEISRREKAPVPEGIRHALGRIESEAGRMTTLVEDLLLLARLDAGRELEREPVDLSRILVESVSDLHAAGPDHVWRLDLPEDVEDFPEVLGDEARLRQVVINLLANARRHTPAGTTVMAGLRRAGDKVVVEVSDDGPGIAPELLPHLFERFTRGDAARTRTEGSTGLGLSIVDAVVSAHDGTVTVDSKPGGTRFAVTLPITGRGKVPKPTAG